MKKLFLFILAFFPIIASADVVEVNGVYYQSGDDSDLTAEVISPPIYKEEVVNNNLEFLDYEYSGDIKIVPYVRFKNKGNKDYKVTRINNFSFWNTKITSVTIPNSVKYIGGSAFSECKNLTSITIPGSVKTIDQFAFSGCSNLTSIELQEGVTLIKKNAFEKCSSLTSITIPSSVEFFGEDAFLGCDNLKSVNISDFVAWCNIEFKGYYSTPLRVSHHLLINGQTINDLTFPDCVTSIGNLAFAYEEFITSVTIPNSVTSIARNAFFYCNNIASVSIPNSVTTIGEGAFNGCSLKTLAIPRSVISIGQGAFVGNSIYLSSISVESGNSKYDSRNNCNALIETGKNKLILGCKNTIIPDDVTSIGSDAFSWSPFISVTIPKSVTDIGEMAFGGCQDLTFIKVEGGNPTYDSRDNCNAIIESKTNKLIEGCKNTIIPNSVSSIGKYAFWALKGLKSIVIPKSVETINDYAFCECRNLTTICCLRKEPPICNGNSTFSGVGRGKCLVWVPKGCVDTYKKATGWKDFQNIQEIIDGDYDLDGKVDGEDVSTLANNISNASADANIGDINGDDEVNVADVVALINKMNGQALLGETAFYLIGDHNSWDMTDKTYAFTKLADGKTWEITIPSEGAGCFKVAPGSAYNHQDGTFWSYLLCAEYDQYTGLHGIMQQGDIMAAWLLNTEGATSYTIRIVPSEMTYQIIPN